MQTSPHAASFEKVLNEIGRVETEFKYLLSLDTSIGDYGRATPPADSFKLIRDWCAFAGVTRLAEATSLDRVGLPNWYTVRPGASCSTAIISSGKGPTRPLAILSALYETFERWAAEEGDFCSFSISALHLKEWFPNLKIVIPNTLTPQHQLHWCVGYDLLTLSPCFIPTANVLFPYYYDIHEVASGLTHTNGLASGTNPIEAICSALFELIERDALARMSKPEIQFISMQSLPPDLTRLTDLFIKQGVDLALYRLYSPTNVPVFYCLSRDDREALSHFFCYGAGAHLDPVIAASRAITEVSQSRVAFITTLRDDIAPQINRFGHIAYPDQRASLDEWFSSDRTHEFPSSTACLVGTYYQLLQWVTHELQTCLPNPAAVAVKLRDYPGVYAFRVFCPQLLGYEQRSEA